MDGHDAVVQGVGIFLVQVGMGIAEVIRDCLRRGQAYLAKQDLAKQGKGEAPTYDQGLENVGRVLRKEIPNTNLPQLALAFRRG